MHFISYLIDIIGTPIFCAFAFFKGATGERWGAVIFFVPALVETIVFTLAKHYGYSTSAITPYVDLISTFAISAGFLYLAVRFASLWLAAAMVVQGSELYFARIFLDSRPANYHAYGLAINLITTFIAMLLAGAAVWSWRSRVVEARADKRRAEIAEERERARDEKFRDMFRERPVVPVAAAPNPGAIARLIIEPPPL